MANRSYLLSIDRPPEIFEGFSDQETIIAGANYSIPVGWLMLFSNNDIKVNRFISENDGSLVDYESLLCEKSVGIRRAKDRWNLIESVIGGGYDYYNKFIQYISELPGKYLYIETAEIWCMSQPGEFLQEIQSYLSALNRKPYTGKNFFLNKKTIDPDWIDLLTQSSITLEPKIDYNPVFLFGYSWINKVPWE